MRLREKLPSRPSLFFILAAVAILLVFIIGASVSSCDEASESGKEGSSQEVQNASSEGSEGVGLPERDNLINLQQTPDSSFLYDVAISDLCAADVSYQKKVVQCAGEVVGTPIESEENSGEYWITIMSAPGEKEGSISVLVDESHLDAIDSYGEYNTRGTILSVKGTFHVACTSHEGIMDIHADTVSAVEAGHSMQDEFKLLDFVPGLILCLVSLVLFFAYRSFAEGER